MAVRKREWRRQLGKSLQLRKSVREISGAPSNAMRLGSLTYDVTSADFYLAIATTAAAGSHKKLD